MLGLLSHSVQAAFLCPLAFGLSLPIAFGQTLLQLTAISPPKPLSSGPSPQAGETSEKEASGVLSSRPLNGKRRSSPRSRSLTPVSEVDEPLSVEPSPAPSKVGRFDLPDVVGRDLFGSPVDYLEADDGVDKDDQGPGSAGVARPSQPANVRRVTWKDDDDGEREATSTNDNREAEGERPESADEGGPADFGEMRRLDESPATIASVEVPTVPHNSPVIPTAPMPGADLGLEDVQLSMPGGTVLRWRRTQHASPLRSQFDTLFAEDLPLSAPIRLSNLYRSFSDPELLDDIRLETPPRPDLRATMSQMAVSSSEPIPQLPFRPRTPIVVDGHEIQALNERLNGSRSTEQPHVAMSGPVEAASHEMSEGQAPSIAVDDERRLSDEESVAALVQSGVEIAIMKQDHCGQEEDSYQGLVLDSEIRSLTKSLDDKHQSRRSSTTETMSAIEHDVAVERRGQFARVEGLPASAPAASPAPEGVPTSSDIFSGLPVFSAGAYELGRDCGPVVAEGVVSPFSLSAAEQDSVTSPSLLPSISLPPSKSRSPSPSSAASTYGSTLTGQEYQSALSELDEEAADEPAALEIDDDSDDDQTPVASMVRKPESSTAGVVPGDLLTPQASPEQPSGPFTPTPQHPSIGATSSTPDRTLRMHPPAESFTSPLPSPPVSPEDLRLPTGRRPQPERVDKDWLPEVSDNRPRAVTPERGRSPAYSPVRNRQPSVGSYEEILRGQREGLYSDRPISDPSTSSVIAQAGSPTLPYFLPASNTSSEHAPSPTSSMIALPVAALSPAQASATLVSAAEQPVDLLDGSSGAAAGAAKKAKKYAKKRAKKEAAREQAGACASVAT